MAPILANVMLILFILPITGLLAVMLLGRDRKVQASAFLDRIAQRMLGCDNAQPFPIWGWIFGAAFALYIMPAILVMKLIIPRMKESSSECHGMGISLCKVCPRHQQKGE